MRLYLQNIVDDISFENLPEKWQAFDFARFSKDKTLFDFQKQGLQNALKALWFYFKDKKADKQDLFTHYQANGFTENFDYDLKKREGKKTAKYLLEYDKDYPATDSKIPFAHFINRMSFWMATGSGKTLIIVKLIELLGKLIAKKELPARDILFLAHRDDLLDQFKNHVEEFNSFNFDTKINLKNLRDYESVKRENALPFAKNEITVFYYRSDLISDEHKEKIVNFQNYDNGGRWYILLDEAHKGDKEDSKRQVLYSILSRNGFLFNFSATFTDPRDFAICAFNFNLSRFVEEGYGKHIYVSSAEISAFRGRGPAQSARKATGAFTPAMSRPPRRQSVPGSKATSESAPMGPDGFTFCGTTGRPGRAGNGLCILRPVNYSLRPLRRLRQSHAKRKRLLRRHPPRPCGALPRGSG